MSKSVTTTAITTANMSANMTAITTASKADTPDINEMHENEMHEMEYLKQLNPLENEALIIAKRQLKTSFDLEKSIGYLKYKTK